MASSESALDRATCARVPAASLAALAALRALPDVRVAVTEESAWVHWRPGNVAARRRVHALPGSVLYERREGLWHRVGERLPCADVPPDAGAGLLPIASAIALPPVEAVLPGASAGAVPGAVALALVPSEEPRPTSGMLVDLAALAALAASATTAQLAALRAARAGPLVLVLGEKIPVVPGGERLHGDRLLAPLGFRVEPALPEAELLLALGLTGELLVLRASAGAEVVPVSALRPLTRAGLRLAVAP
jgi:hypothetical protein